MFKIFEMIRQWINPDESRFSRGYNYAIEQRQLGKTDEELLVIANSGWEYTNFDRGIISAVRLNYVPPPTIQTLS